MIRRLAHATALAAGALGIDKSAAMLLVWCAWMSMVFALPDRIVFAVGMTPLLALVLWWSFCLAAYVADRVA